MEYNKILEEAKVNQMILEKANDAAQNAFYETEHGVVKGYKAIENAVVGGYKKVESAVVGGWEKVEDTCVDTFFKKEGETTQEAMARLSANTVAAKDNTMKGQRA